MRESRIILGSGGVLAIDPGSSSGGIAYLCDGQPQSWPLKDKTEQEIWQIIRACAKAARIAVLERVNAMPKQGVSSTFKFGTSFGALRMALVAGGIHYELVTPSVWQGKMNCRTGGVKKITRDLAQRKFPDVKITNANADAILLACYAEKFLL